LFDALAFVSWRGDLQLANVSAMASERKAARETSYFPDHARTGAFRPMCSVKR
jgi:hypothetical protein